MVTARTVAFAWLSDARVHLNGGTFLVIVICDDGGEVHATLYEETGFQFIAEKACVIASAKASILEHAIVAPC